MLSPVDTRFVYQRHISTVGRSVWYTDALRLSRFQKCRAGTINILRDEMKQINETNIKSEATLSEILRDAKHES